MPEIHVPTIDDLADRLSTLIGKTIQVFEDGSPNHFLPTAQSAIYTTADGELAAIMRLSLELSARLGACLAMMPESSAQEQIESGNLDGDLLDAYGEVVNIMAGLLCRDGAPHVRLASINSCDPALEREFIDALRAPAKKLDLRLTIEGYGDGYFTIWTPKLG